MASGFSVTTKPSSLEGVAELSEKLRQLASPKEQAATLRASVRKPMKAVMGQAQLNISRLSPGKAALHKTYKGRLVSRGFALRSIRMIVAMSKDKQRATAILGVRKEAFYALQFHELGTAYVRSQPWLMPAFTSSRNAMLKGVGEEMGRRIKRIARSRVKGSKKRGK